MSVICTGGAASRCYQAGAKYANPEMIQVHPTPIPGEDKCRLISESARGEGGRVWVPRKAGDTRPPNSIPEEERYYFLEEKYPKYGNIVPRDIATREIFEVCQQGLGVGRREHGLPRPARRGEEARPRRHPAQARRHPRDLREIRRHRSAR
jgi:succinate dehydrogenase / fumarate reductase flavoprotein subunit